MERSVAEVPERGGTTMAEHSAATVLQGQITIKTVRHRLGLQSPCGRFGVD